MNNYGKWAQVDGDMNPSQYGATIAKLEPEYVEVLKIQPVREYVGDTEAYEVGFPFWTREAWFNDQDLALCRQDVFDALNYVGVDWEEEDADLNGLGVTPTQRRIAIACALLDYGLGDEGPAGWAKDVIPDGERVQWWASKRPNGWRFLADEDVEFRAMVREQKGGV
jgi:hypothetical protein